MLPCCRPGEGVLEGQELVLALLRHVVLPVSHQSRMCSNLLEWALEPPRDRHVQRFVTAACRDVC